MVLQRPQVHIHLPKFLIVPLLQGSRDRSNFITEWYCIVGRPSHSHNLNTISFIRPHRLKTNTPSPMVSLKISTIKMNKNWTMIKLKPWNVLHPSLRITQTPLRVSEKAVKSLFNALGVLPAMRPSDQRPEKSPSRAYQNPSKSL